MNYLEQFELNSMSIKLNSGLNQSFYISLAFPDLAAVLERGKECAWGSVLPSSRQGVCKVLGGGQAPLGLEGRVSDLEPDFGFPP